MYYFVLYSWYLLTSIFLPGSKIRYACHSTNKHSGLCHSLPLPAHPHLRHIHALAGPAGGQLDHAPVARPTAAAAGHTQYCVPGEGGSAPSSASATDYH